MKELRESYADWAINALYAGDRIKLSFPSPLARTNFRRQLYARKATQDDMVARLLDEKKKILRFKASQDELNLFWAEFWLEDKPQHFLFYEILPCEDIKKSG